MTASRVLVLGGGSSQVSLLRRCRTLGYHTILADQDPQAPGRQYCDVFELASTFDSPAVLQAARRQSVDGIMTAGTDQPVLTGALVAEELGLPSFLDVETARAVTNKRLMKERFRVLGIPTARNILVGESGSPQDLEVLKPPLVTKPVDSQGQRGVFIVNSAAEAAAAGPGVLAFSRESRFLVEEYYASEEITVSGWAFGAGFRVLTVTDRVTIRAGRSLGVCVAHRFPSRHLSTHGSEIHALVDRIVRGFGITAGPLYFQFLVGEGGILVNEIACRLGGAYEDLFIPRVTGIHPVDWLIRGSLGEDPPDPGPVAADPDVRVSVPLLFCRPGVIHRLEGLENVRSRPGVVAAEWLQSPGARITGLENSTQRAAYLIIEGRGTAEINARVIETLGLLSVRDSAGRNLLRDSVSEACHPKEEQ